MTTNFNYAAVTNLLSTLCCGPTIENFFALRPSQIYKLTPAVSQSPIPLDQATQALCIQARHIQKSCASESGDILTKVLHYYARHDS